MVGHLHINNPFAEIMLQFLTFFVIFISYFCHIFQGLQCPKGKYYFPEQISCRYPLFQFSIFLGKSSHPKGSRGIFSHIYQHCLVQIKKQFNIFVGAAFCICMFVFVFCICLCILRRCHEDQVYSSYPNPGTACLEIKAQTVSAFSINPIRRKNIICIYFSFCICFCVLQQSYPQKIYYQC